MASAKRKAAGAARGAAGQGRERGQDVRLLEGDCLEVLGELEAESVDAIVTDPPYGIGFKGTSAGTRRRSARPRRGQATTG